MEIKKIKQKFALFKANSAITFQIAKKNIPLGQEYEIEKSVLILKAANLRIPLSEEEPQTEDIRKFNWENAITIALDSKDIATLLLNFKRLLKNPNAQTIKIYHDPAKGKKDEGKILKSLSINFGGKEKQNFFLEVSEYHYQTLIKRVTLPLSPEDLIRLSINFEHIIPILDGFHEL